MKIIYSIQGKLPSLSTGGPFRIVGQILLELAKAKYADIHTLLLTNNKIITAPDFIKFLETEPQPSANPNPYKIIQLLFGKQFKARAGFEYRRLIYNLNTKLLWRKWLSENETNDCTIHNHISLSAIPFIKKRNKRNYKIINTYHSKGSIVNDYSADLGFTDTCYTRHIRKIESEEIKQADLITFPSIGAMNLMKTDCPALEGRPIKIIYNGIDTEKIDLITGLCEKRTFSKNQPFRIINVAQHVWQKRIDLLLEAIAKLKNEFPIELINIGDGPDLEKNRSLANKLSISDKVLFVGRKHYRDVVGHILNSDLFVMPSENVIFDLITLEVMWIGKPVIVTKDGGNLECIRPDIDGFLIEKGDIDSLVDKIRFVYSNYESETIRNITESAKTRIIKSFTSEAMVNNYISAYKELNFS